MTAADLTVIVVKGIAPIFRDLYARVMALEATERGLDGATGEKGDPGATGPAGAPGRDGRDGVSVPGPQGEKGADGIDGKNGADGIGFDNFEELYDNERTVTHRYHWPDGRVKEYVLKMPMEIYRGVWVEKAYERGDCVTWAGSEWHCNEATTTKPGEGSKAWTLKVKRGRDGRDGKDGAPAPMPVVTVGGRL